MVEALNADDGVDGILVQLPLPKGIDANVVTGAIRPEPRTWMDLHPENAGQACCWDASPA